MASNAAFAATPNVGIVLATTANANLDGTGIIHDLLSAGGSGTHLDFIRIRKLTATAETYNIFLHDGTSYFFYGQVVFAGDGEQNYALGFDIPSGWKIAVTTVAGNDANVVCFGGDY